MLLAYDGCRSNISVRVLKLLHLNRVVAHALLVDTSGKTQPCDLHLFGVFKKKLHNIICSSVDLYGITHYNAYDFCKMGGADFKQ